jgi:O-methyltransferase involved in polyketide biosynthesis
MQPKEPSRTAWGAARHRAVHQLVDGGAVFKDPFAVSILGGEIGDTHEDPLSREDDNHPGTRPSGSSLLPGVPMPKRNWPKP